MCNCSSFRENCVTHACTHVRTHVRTHMVQIIISRPARVDKNNKTGNSVHYFNLSMESLNIEFMSKKI